MTFTINTQICFCSKTFLLLLLLFYIVQPQQFQIWELSQLFHLPFVFLPFDVAKHLRVPQELAEVNVEHVSAGFQHDVVVMPIADAQNVRGHATTGTRVDKVFNSLWRAVGHGGFMKQSILIKFYFVIAVVQKFFCFTQISEHINVISTRYNNMMQPDATEAAVEL